MLVQSVDGRFYDLDEAFLETRRIPEEVVRQNKLAPLPPGPPVQMPFVEGPTPAIRFCPQPDGRKIIQIVVPHGWTPPPGAFPTVPPPQAPLVKPT